MTDKRRVDESLNLDRWGSDGPFELALPADIKDSERVKGTDSDNRVLNPDNETLNAIFNA